MAKPFTEGPLDEGDADGGGGFEPNVVGHVGGHDALAPTIGAAVRQIGEGTLMLRQFGEKGCEPVTIESIESTVDFTGEVIGATIAVAED